MVGLCGLCVCVFGGGEFVGCVCGGSFCVCGEFGLCVCSCVCLVCVWDGCACVCRVCVCV